MLTLVDRARGCLLGGALGDALGAPVEFLSYDQLQEQFGTGGIVDLEAAYGRVGAITDDTQMTMFTAEGLIRAWNRQMDRGLCNVASVVRHAYLRWLHTQGGTSAPSIDDVAGVGAWPDGWLVSLDALHSQRAPGLTCVSALRRPELGSPEEPLNDSKGCGAVMRAAPIGLAERDPDASFELGCEIGATTHGHPSGYLASGFLAALIARIAVGTPLREAVEDTLTRLRAAKGSEECVEALRAAIRRATEGAPSVEHVVALGGGWVAEEALAMSVYCALASSEFVAGVTLAVNHGGDSDSTGAITGNILGALHGVDALPERWLTQLELGDEIDQLATDIAALHSRDGQLYEWERYPGW